jgi:hypothetical protein
MRRPRFFPAGVTVTHLRPTTADTICSPLRRPFGMRKAAWLEALIQNFVSVTAAFSKIARRI